MYGTVGTQRGLAIGLTTCNAGDQLVGYFAIPGTDHPAVASNLYRMSGGSGNSDHFEQIGQSWVKHTFGAKQADSCDFGCQPGGDFTHLGVGCSDTYFASQSADQSALGSRAWINPFTGVFPSTARDHTGHNHTATSHMILTEDSDLNPAMNPGATYYAELVYVTPDEYSWCQTHPGQCNMNNNASYLQYSITGTTGYTFSPVGSTVRMTPAINAWPGATSRTIEPEPGVDGRAFLAFKVTGPVAGLYHYEYAIYNQNLDRAIQSFSVPLGCGATASNLAFHAPLNHPGFPNDGTLGDAGFSNAPWTSSQTADSVSWTAETFAQNQNANAIRWGTLYNFRFDSTQPPAVANATVGFFKTGTPMTFPVLGPANCGPTPTPGPTGTPTPTPTASPSPTPTPTATPCTGTILSEYFDNVVPPALPPGWVGSCWVTSNVNPDTSPNDAFCPDQSFVSDCALDLPGITIPTASSVLRFRNNFNAEFSSGIFWDGGVLEVSSPNISSGDFLDITDSNVGGSFVSGGYTGEINGDASNPLAGRMAWSGNSHGYIDTVINLGPNLVGQTITLRWRFGSDEQVGAPGWWIDTISLTDGLPCGPTPSPTPTPMATATPAQPTNLSTRMLVQGGDNVGIGGFIITGTVPKQLLLRALGPSLAGSGIPNPLADPVLELHGPPGFATIICDNGACNPGRPVSPITPPPPGSDLEPALTVTLDPGAYTAIVRGNGNPDGVAIMEIFVLDQQADSRLANLSTRAFVGTGGDILIAGFILGGSSDSRIALRGIGPSLGLPNALANPILELRDSNGAIVATNDDWQSDPTQAAELIAAGLAPASNQESGIVSTLSPGAYTALLSGVNNGTGLGLVEVYDLGSPPP